MSQIKLFFGSRLREKKKQKTRQTILQLVYQIRTNRDTASFSRLRAWPCIQLLR